MATGDLREQLLQALKAASGSSKVSCSTRRFNSKKASSLIDQ